MLRLFGPNINKLIQRHDINALIRALRNKRARNEAAFALRDNERGILDQPSAVPALSVALNDKDSFIRSVAIDAFKKIRAIPPLITALEDDDTDNVWTAQDALHDLGLLSVEPLIAALKDGKVRVRRAAAQTLGEIGHASAVQSLGAALNDNDPEVGWLAAEALSKIGDARAVEPLIDALHNRGTYTIVDWDTGHEIPRFVSERAAWALAQLGDPAGIRALRELAQSDPDEGIRILARQVLDTRRLW